MSAQSLNKILGIKVVEITLATATSGTAVVPAVKKGRSYLALPVCKTNSTGAVIVTTAISGRTLTVTVNQNTAGVIAVMIIYY